VEAGKIDGASITKIYRRIILPISKPMFGVVFIYQFTQIYNEFLFAFTLVTGSDAPAAPVTLVLPAIGGRRLPASKLRYQDVRGVPRGGSDAHPVRRVRRTVREGLRTEA
jgi:ABC-type glycerol-3-phosphate transport system permease component